ncbi:hypothetical protein [Streptomyces acidicola]|uniref:hypothetical protein n=1 Tax=Streptomyces acidicola TaxID=2596892 RepID=UPI0037F58FE4
MTHEAPATEVAGASRNDHAGPAARQEDPSAFRAPGLRREQGYREQSYGEQG